MKAVISRTGVAIGSIDVDELLSVYGRFFHIHTPDAHSRDWLEGYALMTGHRISPLCGDEPAPDNRGVVSVTFPELELPL